MPVREQHRRRPQPVPVDDLLDARLGVLARIDDQALLARRRPPRGSSSRRTTRRGTRRSARLASSWRARAVCVQATDGRCRAVRRPSQDTDRHAVGASNDNGRATRSLRPDTIRAVSQITTTRATNRRVPTGGGQEGAPAQARQGALPAAAGAASQAGQANAPDGPCVTVAVVVAVGIGVGRFPARRPVAPGTPSRRRPAPARLRPPAPAPRPATVAEPAHALHLHREAAGRAQGRRARRPRPTSRPTYQATITTNRGAIVIDLLNTKATCTVNSFVYLAAQSFFNNTPCPRLVTTEGIFVLQCGDPTGNGTGRARL